MSQYLVERVERFDDRHHSASCFVHRTSSDDARLRARPTVHDASSETSMPS
jgi:hypothetical protein